MTSTPIYCTYLTIYSGNKLPPFYIGSSSVYKIQCKNYHGSVSSYRYKSIWKSELRLNPQLFKTKIITTHNTRAEATAKELSFQCSLNVVNSMLYMNEALAKLHGSHGRDVSGKLNPRYGVRYDKWWSNSPEKISESLIKYYATDAGEQKKCESSERFIQNNPVHNKDIMEQMKSIWKSTGRGLGSKNGMYGQVGKLSGKKLYNNGNETRAFVEGDQPSGWIKGRHLK